MGKICVVGSINMDYIVEAPKLPRVGETLMGENFYRVFGGKGANQAISAARLGANVSFIGACGDDGIYEEQIKNFKDNNINAIGVVSVSGPSGIATIIIYEGDNSIIVVPGANNKVDIELIDKYLYLIEEADIILLQLEIPLPTIEYVVKRAKELNKIIILNPAPAVKLSKEIIDLVDYLTPNEIEIEQIFEKPFAEVLSNYPNKVIMTKGSEGAYYHNGKELVNVPAIKVDVKDTTGAGDTFNGALAAQLSQNVELYSAIKFANKAAGLSTQMIGAQTSMPREDEINE